MQSSSLSRSSIATSPASADSLFEQMFAIANNNEMSRNARIEILNTLKLQTTRNHIDEFDNDGFLTVAGTLASKGNVEAVEILIELGARVSYAAFGAAYGKQRHFAEVLRTSHPDQVDVNQLAEGAGKGGDIGYAEFLRVYHHADLRMIATGVGLYKPENQTELTLKRKYLLKLCGLKPKAINAVTTAVTSVGDREFGIYLYNKMGANVNYLTAGAAELGDQVLAEQLCLQRKASVDQSVRGAMQGKHVNTRMKALSLLSGLHDDRYRVAFATELKAKERFLNYDVLSLVPSARKISLLRPGNYTFNESVAIVEHPEIKTWFLHAASLLKVMPIDFTLLTYIGTFLAPLTEVESEKLYSRTQLNIVNARTLVASKHTLFANSVAQQPLSLVNKIGEDECKTSASAPGLYESSKPSSSLTPQKRRGF